MTASFVTGCGPLPSALTYAFVSKLRKVPSLASTSAPETSMAVHRVERLGGDLLPSLADVSKQNAAAALMHVLRERRRLGDWQGSLQLLDRASDMVHRQIHRRTGFSKDESGDEDAAPFLVADHFNEALTCCLESGVLNGGHRLESMAAALQEDLAAAEEERPPPRRGDRTAMFARALDPTPRTYSLLQLLAFGAGDWSRCVQLFKDAVSDANVIAVATKGPSQQRRNTRHALEAMLCLALRSCKSAWDHPADVSGPAEETIQRQRLAIPHRLEVRNESSLADVESSIVQEQSKRLGASSVDFVATTDASFAAYLSARRRRLLNEGHDADVRSDLRRSAWWREALALLSHSFPTELLPLASSDTLRALLPQLLDDGILAPCCGALFQWSKSRVPMDESVLVLVATAAARGGYWQASMSLLATVGSLPSVETALEGRSPQRRSTVSREPIVGKNSANFVSYSTTLTLRRRNRHCRPSLGGSRCP